jgi:hypothetical protein
MKKYLLKLTAVVVFLGLLSSCEEDKVIYDGNLSLAAFSESSAGLPVFEDGVSTYMIKVDVSSKSSSARTIGVSVDATSTAVANQYQIETSSLVIPADSYNGEVAVTGNFANLTIGQIVRLVLKLDVVGDATIEPSKNTFTLSIYKSCPSNLAGVYAYSTTNMSTPDSGGSSVAGPVTGNVTFTATAAAGVYTISDASFGGFTALYGISAATGISLVDVCNQIRFSGRDQYGETYTFSNLVVSGNRITFNWSNTFGERGLTTLTRSGSTNWPSLRL